MHRVPVEEELMQNFFFFLRPRALWELTTGRVALDQIDESRTVVYLFIFYEKVCWKQKHPHVMCVKKYLDITWVIISSFMLLFKYIKTYTVLWYNPHKEV